MAGRSEDDFLSEVRKFLDSHHSWVIDGLYSRFGLQERLEQADHIIFLDFPRWSAFARLIKRYWTHRGSARSSAPAGCQEKMDWEFIRFVLLTSRSSKRRQIYQSICTQYAHKLRIARNQAELDALYQDHKK